MIAAAITRRLKVDPTRRAYSLGGGVSAAGNRDSVIFLTFKVAHRASSGALAWRKVSSRKLRTMAGKDAVERYAKLTMGVRFQCFLPPSLWPNNFLAPTASAVSRERRLWTTGLCMPWVAQLAFF